MPQVRLVANSLDTQNDLPWGDYIEYWGAYHHDQPYFALGDILLRHRIVVNAPGFDIQHGDEYQLLVNGDNDPVTISEVSPYEIDVALGEEAGLLDALNATALCQHKDTGARRNARRIHQPHLFASLSNCGDSASRLNSHRSDPSAVFALVSGDVFPSPLGSEKHGMRRFGLNPRPFEGTDRVYELSQDGVPTYHIAWSPAGTWNDIRFSAGSSRLVHCILGREIWLTWPSTAQNREIYFRESESEEPTVMGLIEQLGGLHVACLQAGDAFLFQPGMFYAVLTLDRSAHVGIETAHLDEWEVCRAGLAWEIPLSRLETDSERVKNWTNTHAGRSLTATYPMWEKLFAKDGGDEEKLAELQALKKANRKPKTKKK